MPITQFKENTSQYYDEGISVKKIWESKLSKEELSGLYKGNIIKYICRAGKKTDDEVEDLKKARNYLQWLIELKENKDD